ncbi:LamB/YcsF family protein [Streptomyces sp. NPDC001508]|uniref:LamB/YcsF family protein n=1 Tax=Streptomyces sp. NPDC001508 TaxID=3154656 RepID=UPI003326B113
MTATVDINADLAEGYGRWTLGDDTGLLDSADEREHRVRVPLRAPLTVWRTLPATGARYVAVGAHVSYRDLAGFGRRYLAASRPELTAAIAVRADFRRRSHANTRRYP